MPFPFTMAWSAQQLFEVTYPGTWARLCRYGTPRDVTFERQPSELSKTKLKDVDEATKQPTEVFLAIEVEAPSIGPIGLIIRIVVTVRLRGGVWLPKGKYFSFHCGPAGQRDRKGEVFFRVDLDQRHDYHFHVRTDEDPFAKAHPPYGEADQPLGDMTPPRFLDLVDKFVKSGCKEIPIKRKP